MRLIIFFGKMLLLPIVLLLGILRLLVRIGMEVSSTILGALMSFYRNFESKEDILRKWITGVTDNFLKVSGISYKNESTESYFTKLFTHLEQYKTMCTAMYRAGLIYLIKEQFDRVFIELHSKEYDDYKSYFLAGGIYNVFLLWLQSGCKERPEELADRLGSIFVK